jgi:hypothetical protein
MKRFSYTFLLLLTGSLLLGYALMTGGCAKSRQFTHVDSIPEVPAQFHFFNAFAYDSSLSLSVDGLLRQNVPKFALSSYYPSSSAFNLNAEQPNSKQIMISDPTNTSEFATTSTFQFQPLTSYLVFPLYNQYDTILAPKNTTVPYMFYYPEDINTPLDGTARVRFFTLMAENSGSGQQLAMTISPNAGAGTTLSLPPIYTGTQQQPVSQPVNAAVTYTGTQPGQKFITLSFGAAKQQYGNSINLKVSYLATQLDNANYTFLSVGDPKNYLNGLEPLPQLYMMKDGDSTSVHALTVSSITYPGNNSSTANVRVINTAYNVPGLLSLPQPNSNNFIYYQNLQVALNNYTAQVIRWEIINDPPMEGQIINGQPGPPYPNYLSQRIASFQSIQPGIYSLTFTPNGTFGPVYDVITYTFQQGISYSAILVPSDTTAKHCGNLLLQDDNAPNPNNFRLRVINVMGGAPGFDIHVGSPTGPLLVSNVPFGQATDYINLPPNSTSQNLYVTAVGSSDLLFPQGGADMITSMPYTAGNSATIYLEGLVPGTPYSGDPLFSYPYILYVTDAYIDPNAQYNNGQPTSIFYN